MAAVSSYIYKISQRCNLNCDYCYVYHGGDTSWESRPALSSLEVTKKLISRIIEHCRHEGLEYADLEIHGGEPLLMGKLRMREHFELIRDASKVINIRTYLQTNAILLDLEWLDLFSEYGVQFGISLDGPIDVHDAHRKDHNGNGSHKRIVEKIETLCHEDKFKRLFTGILAVISPFESGHRIMSWFSINGINQVDFLLPDHTRNNCNNQEVEACGQFLIDAFDTWLSLGSRAPAVRFFRTAVESKCGKRPTLDALGGTLSHMCVIESDGSLFTHDVLRIALPNLTDKLSVYKNEIGEIHKKLNTSSIETPCQQCVECRHFNSCGGGYLPHRWDGNSFANPSLYCDSLYRFYEHVERRLFDIVPANLWKKLPIGTAIDTHSAVT